MAAIALAVAGGGGGVGAAAVKQPSVQAIQQAFEDKLAGLAATMLLRMHLRRTTGESFSVTPLFQSLTAPGLVSAVEWVDLSNGDERWLYYSGSGRLRIESSRTLSASSGGTSENMQYQAVSFYSKTWSQRDGGSGCHALCASPQAVDAACNCAVDPFTDFRYTPPLATVVGQERVDGQMTFHVRFAQPDRSWETVDWWVNSSTYLPVHEKVVAAQETTTVDYDWLPRTPANLAQLTVPIPSGFKRV